MIEATSGVAEAPATYPERWVTFVARRATSPWFALLDLAAAALFAVLALAGDMWPSWLLATLWACGALFHWERVGYRRLLARKQAEVDELRVRAGSG